MFSKAIAIRRAGFTLVLNSVVLLSQPAPAGPSSSAGLEFPVIMRQRVAAGATPVGTKVQAKLAFATLVGRVVVPEGAVLSGEVTESVAKSTSDASRLGIRMDSAQWKRHSVTIKVYLTAWMYPPTPPIPDLSTDPPDGVVPATRRRRGSGTSTYPSTRDSAPFPRVGAGTDPAPPPPSRAPGISKHRVLMENVESTVNNGGAISLTSKRVNLKLDKGTTYVLAGNPLIAN
jgi:hypothetical protein